MPAYVVGVLKVQNAEGIKDYQSKVPAVIEQYGGRYLVRGGENEALDGVAPGDRFVVLEFPDRAAARRFYDSPEYQAIVGGRLGNSEGFLVAVDGY